MDNIISKKQRQELLKEIFNTQQVLFNLIDEYEAEIEKQEPEAELLSKIAQSNFSLEQMREAYLNGLSSKALSRCPYTGDILTRTIDLDGIDGLWWDYDEPLRAEEEQMPTYFAMDGALKLFDNIEQFPFTCSIGPEVPFVLPRLLQHTAIKAVLSSFPVRKHRLFIITYYSEPIMNRIRRVNDLGTYCYKYKDHNGWVQHDFYQDPLKDFELDDWIKSGKLLWIEPDDTTLTLRSFLTGCPYLDLSGSHKVLSISNGEVKETNDPEWLLETSELLPDENDYVSLEEIARKLEFEEEVILDIDAPILDEIKKLSIEEIERKTNEEEQP